MQQVYMRDRIVAEETLWIGNRNKVTGRSSFDFFIEGNHRQSLA